MKQQAIHQVPVFRVRGDLRGPGFNKEPEAWAGDGQLLLFSRTEEQ